MLRQLKLTNFRQHEDLTLDFDDGLVVLRGKNEAGKSTIILGVLYALFGAKVLPLSLAETVTWGKPDNSLAVQVIVQVEGQQYLFKRGKSGAECHHSGGSVTGQTEVSNFATEILGADYATVSKLMIANQNNLRGALEEGPKAVSQYIEDLSGMDLFDTLLNLAGEKLLTGNTGIFEEAVVSAIDTLDQIKTSIVEPDWQSYDDAVRVAETELAANEAIIVETKPMVEESKTTVSNMKAQLAAYEQAVSQVELLKSQLAKIQGEYNDALYLSSKSVDVKHMKKLENVLHNISSVDILIDIYETFSTLQYPKDTLWEGTVEAMNQYADEATKKRESLNATVVALKETAKSLKLIADKSINIDTVCPECGQEFADAASKKAHIAQLQKEKTQAQLELAANAGNTAKVIGELEEVQSDLMTIDQIRKIAVPFTNFALKHGDLVKVDINFFPPKLTWAVEVPSNDLDPDVLQRELDGLKKLQLDVEMAKVKAQDLLSRATDIEAQIAGYTLQEVDMVKLAKWEATAHELQEAYLLAVWKVSTYKERIVTAKSEKEQARTQYDIALAGIAAAEQNVVKAQVQLNKLVFNNNLLKKIRSARPLVADKLWSTVLMSVSTMFSSMRGTPSIVTKGKDGFAVNGAPIAGLSGSTLDILGLALRSSLVKSFLPHTAMMVLDEPGAAMDQDRAINMLGFIAASGFSQTLLITHDDVSEQFADQIISI